MIRIKDRLKVQSILSNVQVDAPQYRHKLVSVVLGMVMGERLDLPSVMTNDVSEMSTAISQLWTTLHQRAVFSLAGDFKEIYVHDYRESARLAQCFWSARYVNAAPRTRIVVPTMATPTFSDLLLSFNTFFSQNELEFMNKNIVAIVNAFNEINDNIEVQSL